MCGSGGHRGHEGCGCHEGTFGPAMGRREHGCCRVEGGAGVAWQPGMRFHRRFSTREERIARLEEYLKNLQAEAKAVEERLAEMKAGS